MTNTQKYDITLELEALNIGLGCAQQVAEEYHRAMTGYQQSTHDALDADVTKIKEAIAALTAAQQPQENLSMSMFASASDYAAAKAKQEAALQELVDQGQELGMGYEAQPVAVPDKQRTNDVVLNGRQLRDLVNLLDQGDGDDDWLDVEIGVRHFDEVTIDDDLIPAGLYYWFTEYPEEGRMPVPDADESTVQTPTAVKEP